VEVEEVEVGYKNCFKKLSVAFQYWTLSLNSFQSALDPWLPPVVGMNFTLLGEL